jgi:hypothetical protein
MSASEAYASVSVVLFFAGDKLTVSLTVQNTGSLRVEDLTLTADTSSLVSVDDLVCHLHSDTPAAFSFGAASVLQPGQFVECYTEYIFTPADIEGIYQTVAFALLGSAASGAAPSDTVVAGIGTLPRNTLEMDLFIDQCTQPLEPGDTPGMGARLLLLSTASMPVSYVIYSHAQHSAEAACWLLPSRDVTLWDCSWHM